MQIRLLGADQPGHLCSLISAFVICCLDAKRSSSVGRALDWGSKGLLVRDSLPAESLCCVLEQDTLSDALTHPNLTEKLLTGM